MDETKYDFSVEKNHTSSHDSYHDWYKEPVQTKYLRQVKPGQQKHFYNTKNWIFLRQGLDDFRDGFPPIGSRYIKQAEKRVLPALHNDFVTITEIKEPRAMKKLNRYHTYLSRCTPQQQQQRNFIDSVQQGLLQHPLALFPHFEQSVIPELFEDVVNILDPQFNAPELMEEEVEFVGKMDEEGEGDWSSERASFRPGEDEKPKVEQISGSEPIRNLYRWNPQKESVRDNKKVKEKEKAWPIAQSEEEHIKQVTREFCDWVADLGGESNNIEESTITSLFASGYDTKPALSVPIHVVDLANVPQELRLSAVVPPPALLEKPTQEEYKPKKKIKGDYEPAWVKFRYGAWYLSPSTWRKMGYYEPLEDPKQLKEHEMSEAKKKSHELNQELATMHAASAFSEFITKKNTRKPEFLIEVAEIKKKAALEELKRQEAEQLAKQKKTASQQKESKPS